MLELVTTSADETRAVGGALAPLLGSGDVVSLTGDLGAGKTTFVQGAAAALDVEEPVLSPTFTLVREYRGAFRIYHVDVYRLDRVQEVLDLGFDEMLDRGAIVFIEWGDMVDSLIPDAFLQVEIQLAGEANALDEQDEGPRRLLLSATGESWETRWRKVLGAMERWAVPREEPVGGAG